MALACPWHQGNQINVKVLGDLNVRIYGRNEDLIDDEERATLGDYEENSQTLVCERCLKAGELVFIETWKTTMMGRLLGYRVELPGPEENWVSMKPIINRKVRGLDSVSFVNNSAKTLSNPSLIVVDSPSTLAKLVYPNPSVLAERRPPKPFSNMASIGSTRGISPDMGPSGPHSDRATDGAHNTLQTATSVATAQRYSGTAQRKEKLPSLKRVKTNGNSDRAKNTSTAPAREVANPITPTHSGDPRGNGLTEPLAILPSLQTSASVLRKKEMLAEARKRREELQRKWAAEEERRLDEELAREQAAAEELERLLLGG